MTLKQFLIIMSVFTVVALATLAAALMYFDPTSSSFSAPFIFYSSLSISSLGVLTLLGFGLRQIFGREAMAFRMVAVSFRQAIWLTILLVASLMLMHANKLNILSAILLILALTIAEALFLMEKKRPNHIS